MKNSPVFMAKVTSIAANNVRDKVGDLYWFDLEWGQSWSEGAGYIGMVPWGEQKERTGYCRDNRQLVAPDDVEIELLGWTADEESPERVILVVSPRQ